MKIKSYLELALVLPLIAAVACGDDDDGGPIIDAPPPVDAPAADAPQNLDAPTADATPGVDAPAAPDAAIPDAAVPDAAVPDAAVPDAATPPPDAAVADAAVPDAAVPDAAPPPDAPPDAAPPDAPGPNCTPTSGTDLTLELVASGLSEPVFVTSPPGDPRLFILEKLGRVRVVENGQLLATPFLDITDRVMDLSNEQGLLGMAFHPNYAQNGRFVLDYIEARTATRGRTVVGEYQVSAGDPNRADRTERRILAQDQPRNNHNGGMVAFGPDGYLYISLGDSGGGGDPDQDAQDVTTLLGSILRIDIDSGSPYAIPADNPFAGSPGGPNDPRREIWAYGLRNPWRFSFDSQTGDLYIGDVGQNAIEEVNVQAATAGGGQNYGWDIFEADSCVDPHPINGCSTIGLTFPVTQYDHNLGGCSITGGYVYRGTCLPDIQGHYFYADYCSDQVRTIEWVGGEIQRKLELGNIFGSRISSFGEDANGELYVVNLVAGRVSRVVAANP